MELGGSPRAAAPQLRELRGDEREQVAGKMLRLTEPLNCAKCSFRRSPRGGRREDRLGATRHKLLAINDFGKDVLQMVACAFCAKALCGQIRDRGKYCADIAAPACYRTADTSNILDWQHYCPSCNHPLCIWPFRSTKNLSG